MALERDSTAFAKGQSRFRPRPPAHGRRVGARQGPRARRGGRRTRRRRRRAQAPRAARHLPGRRALRRDQHLRAPVHRDRRRVVAGRGAVSRPSARRGAGASAARACRAGGHRAGPGRREGGGDRGRAARGPGGQAPERGILREQPRGKGSGDDDDRHARARRALHQHDPHAVDGRRPEGQLGPSGRPMALAPLAYVLYTRVMRHNPPTRTGPTATASCSPRATRRCCSTRCST